MKILDPNDPFFRRTWVRVVTVVVPLAWSVVEFFVSNSPGWGMIFLAFGVFAAWVLFFGRKPEN